MNCVVVLLLVVVLGYVNEKFTKFTYEIALMLFSIIVGGVCLGIWTSHSGMSAITILDGLYLFDLEGFLMEGVLCFMLFAGSCHMRLLDFKKYAKEISLLSIVATLLGAIFYGLLIFGAAKLLSLPLSLPVCLMFGSVVAPTDPIAATSILKKFNLPKNIGFLMESESLLNDGVGVALFVCFSGLVTAEENGGFFVVMAKELFGAVIVGIVVSLICLFVFCNTKDETRRIFCSLLAVSASYLLCEHFGFSGAIASVVCGLMFSGARNLRERNHKPIELDEYDSFWHILDSLLNSVLYVMLGFSFLHILQMPHVLLLSIIAIVANLIGRSCSVGVAAKMIGKLPDGYDLKNFIKIMTWGGLRGGLCVALAMSTQSMLPADVYYIVIGGTYAIVFFTTVIQGMTMPRVYKRIEKSVRRKVRTH